MIVLHGSVAGGSSGKITDALINATQPCHSLRTLRHILSHPNILNTGRSCHFLGHKHIKIASLKWHVPPGCSLAGVTTSQVYAIIGGDRLKLSICTDLTGVATLGNILGSILGSTLGSITRESTLGSILGSTLGSTLKLHVPRALFITARASVACFVMQ